MEVINGKVVQIIDRCTIVINRGSSDGVLLRQRFLVYNYGDELFDPDTNESLGMLEIVCGIGKPTHIQERLTTIESDKFEVNEKTIKRSNNSYILNNNSQEEIISPPVRKPFEYIHVGSLVRLI